MIIPSLISFVDIVLYNIVLHRIILYCIVGCVRVCDGTSDRALCVWLIAAQEGATLRVKATHQRAGSSSVSLTLQR